VNYATPAAFRVALDTRLANNSRETGVDLNRLRRRVVFERLLMRLEDAQRGRWVLKGGMALEVRWRDRARATRDLDLAMTDGAASSEDLLRMLTGALELDPQGDWFQFVLGSPRVLAADEEGRPGWRVPVEARLAGRQFAKVILDVVLRMQAVGGTERLPLPGALVFAGLAPTDVAVIDRDQHFAEKLHALTRVYFGRPNSRVKDLPDLLLLIEDGLQPSSDLLAAVRRVFAVRATHEVPADLPDPPVDWAGRYAELAANLDLIANTIDRAMQDLRAFWARVRSTEET
jgi:hypothetical protein